MTRTQVLRKRLRLSRQNDVCRFVSHLLFHQRNSNAGQVPTERLKPAQHRTFDWTEEARDALNIQNVDQLVSGPRSSVTSERLVSQLSERGFVPRVLNHTVQFSLLPSFRWRLKLSSARLNLPCKIDRSRCYTLQIIGIDTIELFRDRAKIHSQFQSGDDSCRHRRRTDVTLAMSDGNWPVDEILPSGPSSNRVGEFRRFWYDK